MLARRLPILLLAGLLLALAPIAAAAETVALPVTIDYPLLRRLIVEQSFTGPGESALVADELGGCTRIELSRPQVSPESGYLRLRCALSFRVGVGLAGKCLKPVDWRGYIELVQEPHLASRTWELSFITLESRLFTAEGEPANLAQAVWDLVKTRVHAYLDRRTISLAPPVKELGQFLPLVVYPENRARVDAWLKSLRPGRIHIRPLDVRVELLMEVQPSPPSAEERLSVSQDELDRFTRAWQSWDAFLVRWIEYLAREPLSTSERRLLLETLLEARYRFVQELNQPTPAHRDIVREQFVAAWQRLSPILHRRLRGDEQRGPLSYLAFFTAGDALEALDKLGPTLGVDISHNGLIRLVRLMEGEELPGLTLDYGFGVDEKLRRDLGLGPAPDESGPAFSQDHLAWPPPAAPGLTPPSPIPQAAPADPAAPAEPAEPSAPQPGSWLRRLLARTAWAAGPPEGPGLEALLPWVPNGDNHEVYLERIKQAVRVAAAKTIGNGPVDRRHADMFERLALATAWQESCLRQFVATGGKIAPLRSYNNTSVGLMQINERVWRGLYNLNSLRWNVLYNVKAGCEILELYLREYALPNLNPARPLDEASLARAVYAMYNGGPAQFQRFLKRHAQKNYYLSDKLFAEKLAWVQAGRWELMSHCLGR
ncbi:MAG: transglycosylase SLT domain-containing protein [Thermodesulfobacteriota bacterium]